MTQDELYFCLSTLNEGFDFAEDDDTMSAAEYDAVEVGTDTLLKAALKDMDIKWALTAVAGIVPSKGWKVQNGEVSQLLTLDSKWSKWAHEMVDRLKEAGWSDIGPDPIDWHDRNAIIDAGGKPPYPITTQRHVDEYNQKIQLIPEEAFKYVPAGHNNPILSWYKSWWKVFISPDGGLFAVFPCGWKDPNVLGATGKKYYIQNDVKYDVKEKMAMNKLEGKAATFLRHKVPNSVSRFIERDDFRIAFDSQGYPVFRLLANESKQKQLLSKAAARRGAVAYEHNRMEQYGLEHFYLSDIQGNYAPCRFYLGGYSKRPTEHDVYAAVYVESLCPEVFDRCRDVCAQNGNRFLTTDGEPCTAIFEYGLTESGVRDYKKSVLDKLKK